MSQKIDFILFFMHVQFIRSDMASFFRFLSLLIKHTLKLSQIIHNFYSGIVALVGEKEKLLAIKGWSTTKWKLHKFLSCIFQNITHSSQSATAFLVFLRHVRYYCNLCMYYWFLGAFFQRKWEICFILKEKSKNRFTIIFVKIKKKIAFNLADVSKKYFPCFERNCNIVDRKSIKWNSVIISWFNMHSLPLKLFK